MPKKIFMCMILLSLFLVGCSYANKSLPFNVSIYHIDALETVDEVVYIRSNQDILDYLDQLDRLDYEYVDKLKSYDDDYFKSHSLVLINIVEPSASNTLTVYQVGGNDTRLTVFIKDNVPAIGNNALLSWNFIIELTDNTNTYHEVTYQIRDRG